MSNQNNTRFNGKTDASKILVTRQICNYDKTICFTIADLINSSVITTFAELVARLAFPGISGIIYLAVGTFAVTQTLTIPDGVSLIGSGAGTILNITSNIGTTFLTLGSNCMIKDLTIDVNGSGTVSAIAVATEESNVLISGITIIDTNGAITLGTNTSNVRIINCIFDTFETGIISDATSNKVYIIGNSFSQGVTSTLTLDGTNIIVNNNRFDACNTSTRTDGNNVLFCNNVITAGVNYPLEIIDSTTNKPNMIINGNNITIPSGNPILNIPITSTDLRNIMFNTNICSNSGATAIVAYASGSTAVANMTIIDNLIPSDTIIKYIVNSTDAVALEDLMVRHTSSYFSFTTPALTTAGMSANFVELTNAGAVVGTLRSLIRGPTVNKLYVSVTANTCAFNAVNCDATPDTAFFPAVNSITAGNKALFMWSGYAYIRLT